MVKKRTQNKKNIFTNVIIISTLLLTTSFFVSFADYLFFGNVEEIVHPDLESLIPKTKYLKESMLNTKKKEASFNIKDSQFGQKFGKWMVYIEKKRLNKYHNIKLYMGKSKTV